MARTKKQNKELVETRLPDFSVKLSKGIYNFSVESMDGVLTMTGSSVENIKSLKHFCEYANLLNTVLAQVSDLSETESAVWNMDKCDNVDNTCDDCDDDCCVGPCYCAQ